MTTAHYAPLPPDPVDISEVMFAVCRKLGVDPSYVYRLDVDVAGWATVYCYAGADGFCKGKKYVVSDPASPWDGRAALEPPLRVRVEL